MDKILTLLLPSIEHFQLLGYWFAFFAALFETVIVVGLFFPGSTLLLLLGALAANGQFDFGDLLWFAIAGAVLGDNLNYWLGQRYGHKWTSGGIWFITPEHLAKTRSFFDRHGAKSVFLGRFIPSVKEITPFIAGTVGMRHRTFLLWNILGSIGWGLEWVGGGYLFGQSLKLAETWMSRAGLALLFLLILLSLLWFLKRFVLNNGRVMGRVVISLWRSVKTGLERNQYVRRLIRRHPKSVRFLSSRVSREHFTGLPLTVLILAFVYVLALFAGIVEDVITSDTIVSVDYAAAQLIATFRVPAILPPFVWITAWGKPQVVIVLALTASIMLWLFNRKYAISGLLIASLGASIFTSLGKLAFQRPRPIEAVLIEHSYSFPSGHATGSVAFYGFIGYLLMRSAAGWKMRINIAFSATGVILLIGLSRIVLGVHYLSDVWAGYLVGTLWLIIGISLTEWLSACGRIDWHAATGRGREVIAYFVLLSAIAGVVWYTSTRTMPAPITHSEQIIEVNKSFIEFLHDRNLARTASIIGEAGQPLSFIIAAPDIDVVTGRMNLAGWLPADKPNLQNMMHLLREGMAYSTAPVAPAFWNNRINDLAFERPVSHAESNGLATVTIWKTSFAIGAVPVFVGAVREYDGIRWGLVHKVSPDVDAATAAFVQSLGLPGQLDFSCQQPFVPPLIGGFLLGDRFFTQGQLYLLDLRNPPDLAQLCEPAAAGQSK